MAFFILLFFPPLFAEPVAFLTDLEGDYDKLVEFARKSGAFEAGEGELRLKPDHRFVYGGDAVDWGPGSIRIVRALVDLKKRLIAEGRGEDLTLLAGNRETVKIRLVAELSPDSPPEKVKEFLAKSLGAGKAFEMRQGELELLNGRKPTDQEVAGSFFEELRPGGLVREYLGLAKLAHRDRNAVFVHGALTDEKFKGETSIDAYVAKLNAWYREQLALYDRTGNAQLLVDYPYGFYSDDTGNPALPSGELLRKLKQLGIDWIFVGHRPYAETPTVLQGDGVGIVIADNSSTKTRHAPIVVLENGGRTVRVSGYTHLNRGDEEHAIEFKLGEGGDPLIGRRTAEGFLVRGRTSDGRYLLSRIRSPRWSEDWREERLVARSELDTLGLHDPCRRNLTAL